MGSTVLQAAALCRDEGRNRGGEYKGEGGRERRGHGRESERGSRSERARAWEEETPQSRPASGDTPYSSRTGEKSQVPLCTYYTCKS